jgi:hypothetical protein
MRLGTRAIRSARSPGAGAFACRERRPHDASPLLLVPPSGTSDSSVTVDDLRDRRRVLVVFAIAATAALGGAALGAVGTVLATRDCSFSQATWNAGRENEADYEVLKHDLRLLVRCGTLEACQNLPWRGFSVGLTAIARVNGSTTSAFRTCSATIQTFTCASTRAAACETLKFPATSSQGCTSSSSEPLVRAPDLWLLLPPRATPSIRCDRNRSLPS